jgi:hypothetical protein
MAATTARLAGVLVLAAVSAAGAQDAGAPEVCDRLRPVSSVLGYKVREPSVRCEGLYESAVRAVGLEVVGLMKGEIVPDLAEHAEVEIVGPDPSDLPAGAGPVRVRAVALPLKAYYRMDGVLDARSSLAWPIAEVVRPAGLEPKQIGLFGWIGDETAKIFVPVGVRAAGEGDAGEDLRLYIRVTSDAETLYWRVREGGAESEWTPAAGGRVRSGQTVMVTLPPGPEAVIGVDVTAKPVDSDEWTSLRFDALRASP